MKVLAFLIATAAFQDVLSYEVCTRVWAMACNTSGITFVNPFCRIKAISRAAQTLNGGAEIVKPLDELFGSFLVEYKMSQNWRHIFQSPDIEYCSAIKLGKTFQFHEIFEKNQKLFVNNSVDCPLQPGPYSVMNFKITYCKEQTKSESGFGTKLPNGRYRFTIKAFTKVDPVGMFIRWVTEIRDKFGEENF